MSGPSQGWTIAIHGGAGSMTRGRLSEADDAAARAALGAALNAGVAVLAAGGSALDAVQAAVAVLEDDPAFNAGRGAVFTLEGRIELDAAIMDGPTRRAGAVAGLTRTRHPVAAARCVMERSPHVLLARDGADAFTLEHGLEQVEPDFFATPERRRQLDEMRTRGAKAFDAGLKYGTVGAVARDGTGGLAAATSTGGLTGKRWARIGDSPLIGAGTWADAHAAVSATGSGEQFIRAAAAHEIAARVRLAGYTVPAAAKAALAEVERLGGTGGLVHVGREGAAGWTFVSPGMNRAAAHADGTRTIAIYGDEG